MTDQNPSPKNRIFAIYVFYDATKYMLGAQRQFYYKLRAK